MIHLNVDVEILIFVGVIFPFFNLCTDMILIFLEVQAEQRINMRKAELVIFFLSSNADLELKEVIIFLMMIIEGIRFSYIHLKHLSGVNSQLRNHLLCFVGVISTT